MKRTIVLIILIVSIIVVIQGFSFKKDKIRLVPVYEKTLKDTIVDVIFDTATVKIEEAKAIGWKKEAFGDEEKRIGEGKIFYTKVIILKKGKRKLLKFFDSKGKQKKSFETADYAEVIVSQNKKYIGITTPTKLYEGEHESKFQMVDNDGNIFWEITGLGTGPYTPSPDGRLTIGTPSVEMETAPIEIYNKKGLLKKIDNPYGIIEYAFSENGKYIAISVAQSKNWKSPIGYLLLIDSLGNNIWKKYNYNVWNIKFCNDDKNICFKMYNENISAMLLNVIKRSNGRKVMSIPYKKGKIYYIYNGGDHLFVLNELEREFSKINIVKSRIEWTKRIEKGIPRTISLLKIGSRIIVVGYPNYIYIYNNDGKLLIRKEITNNVSIIRLSQKDKLVVCKSSTGKLVWQKIKEDGL